MGNTPSSSSARPDKGSQAAHGLHQQHRDREDRDRDRDRDSRREPRRRESIPALTSKTSAASPSLDTTLASGQAIFPSASSPSQPRQTPPSHSRNRSNTSGTPKHEPSSPSVPRQAKSLKSPSPPPEPRLSPASQPVDVPQSQKPCRPVIDTSAPTPETYHPPPASFSRPPRLPLPIEEETHAPGSPIISPSPGHGHGDLPRRSSVVSSTMDDDEEPDNFEGYTTDAQGPKVPTMIEWRNASSSDRIYVTGTFTNWERKFRLHKDGPSKLKNALSATLQLPPGTHHIKFIVNGDMLTSNDLPTTVDYTNILVNYVEVSLDQLPLVAPGKPVPAGPAPERAQTSPSRPMDIRPNPASTDKDATTPSQPQNTPPKTTGTPVTTPAVAPVEKQKAPPLVRQQSREWTQTIPAYLGDLDSWYPPSSKDDNSHATSPSSAAARYRFERANAAAESQPNPPSLPMFLSKSILNGTTPTKDDSSVLIMPNHTVLNHLATTNIKQGVLATSATTRYKRKFLTTIMYKPRNDGEE